MTTSDQYLTDKFTNFRAFVQESILPLDTKGKGSFYFEKLTEDLSPLAIRAFIKTEIEPHKDNLKQYLREFAESNGVQYDSMPFQVKAKLERYVEMFVVIANL